MKPKIANFLTESQVSARTVRWPWRWLGILVVLVRLIISRLFHVAPIPATATQNTAPARKPLRVFSFWKLRTRGFKVFACAIVLSLSGQLAAGEFLRGVLSVSAVQILAEADEKYGQGQQQNTQIEQGHSFLLVRVVKTEGIWLWARVWTLCSPVGVGNLLTTKKPIGTWTYTFDDADRLETVLTPEMHTTTYSYDKNSNRTVAKGCDSNLGHRNRSTHSHHLRAPIASPLTVRAPNS